MENEENSNLRISIDYARRGKDGPKVKISAAGNSKEELEENLALMKEIALREMM